MVRFDGQVVLVTGAGRGIGRAHARLLAERGAHVVVNDIDGDVAGVAAQEIVVDGGRASCVAGDIVDDARSIVSGALAIDGRLDALINNAGIAYTAPFGPDAVPDVERLLRIHAVGSAAVTAAAWDSLVAVGGRVVNTTSSSVLGLMNHAAYAAAKGAVLGFTRALALEAAPLGVRVNAVMPLARTRMYEIAGGTTGDAIDQLMSEHFPPERTSPMVAYLASDEVACNGAIIETSGGSSSVIEFAVCAPFSTLTPELAAEGLVACAPDAAQICSSNDELLGNKFAMIERWRS